MMCVVTIQRKKPPSFVTSEDTNDRLKYSTRRKSKANVYFNSRRYLGSEILSFVKESLSFSSTVREHSVQDGAGQNVISFGDLNTKKTLRRAQGRATKL